MRISKPEIGLLRQQLDLLKARSNPARMHMPCAGFSPDGSIDYWISYLARLRREARLRDIPEPLVSFNGVVSFGKGVTA